MSLGPRQNTTPQHLSPLQPHAPRQPQTSSTDTDTYGIDVLITVLQDYTDSDNQQSLSVYADLVHNLKKSMPGRVKAVYVHEPRHVSLGLENIPEVVATHRVLPLCRALFGESDQAGPGTKGGIIYEKLIGLDEKARREPMNQAILRACHEYQKKMGITYLRGDLTSGMVSSIADCIDKDVLATEFDKVARLNLSGYFGLETLAHAPECAEAVRSLKDNQAAREWVCENLTWCIQDIDGPVEHSKLIARLNLVDSIRSLAEQSRLNSFDEFYIDEGSLQDGRIKSCLSHRIDHPEWLVLRNEEIDTTPYTDILQDDAGFKARKTHSNGRISLPAKDIYNAIIRKTSAQDKPAKIFELLKQVYHSYSTGASDPLPDSLSRDHVVQITTPSAVTGNATIKALDIEQERNPLIREIEEAKKVYMIGGASWTIPAKVLSENLGSKVAFYGQGGTFNTSLNILPNPFNFQLNLAAVQYCFYAHTRNRIPSFAETSGNGSKSCSSSSFWPHRHEINEIAAATHDAPSPFRRFVLCTSEAGKAFSFVVNDLAILPQGPEKPSDLFGKKAVAYLKRFRNQVPVLGSDQILDKWMEYGEATTEGIDLVQSILAGSRSFATSFLDKTRPRYIAVGNSQNGEPIFEFSHVLTAGAGPLTYLDTKGSIEVWVPNEKVKNDPKIARAATKKLLGYKQECADRAATWTIDSKEDLLL